MESNLYPSEDLLQLIDTAKTTTNFIAQEFIHNSRGRDLRVFVVEGRVIAFMERISKDIRFKENSSVVEKLKNILLAKKLNGWNLKSVRNLDLKITGVNLLFDGKHFKICEVNSSLGYKGLEKCFPLIFCIFVCFYSNLTWHIYTIYYFNS